MSSFAARADGARRGVITLCGDALYALANPYRLGPYVSTHHAAARGFAAMFCYLLREDDGALLLDTGLSAHEAALLGQLGSLLGPETKLSVWPTRMGEFNSLCNVRPIIEEFEIETLYGSQERVETWVDFRPDRVPYGTPLRSGQMGTVRTAVVAREDTLDVGDTGRRRVRAFAAPIRLLPTHWVYDEKTRTLFTSDSFTYGCRPTADGPWVITDDDDPTTAHDVRTCLVGSRFWWLPGARTEPLRRAIARVFATYEVESVAPGYGCILKGARTVRRHVALLDELLASFAHEAPPRALARRS